MINQQSSGTNYYEILEVAQDAPAHEIYKAYQRARGTYSSDNPALYSMFSADEAKELLRLIEEAYSVLGNPTLRKSYDDARERGEAPPPAPITQPVKPPQRSSSPAKDPVQVASAHQALPDFTPPDSEKKETLRELAANTGPKKNTLPPGTGKTPFSTYKIDDSFESQLKGAADFDGNFIQRIRLYKNISIDRMSEATRISRPYLMAVEANDFKSLPAAVFVRGFVVQMARILGLEEQRVATSYIKIFKAGGGK